MSHNRNYLRFTITERDRKFAIFVFYLFIVPLICGGIYILAIKQCDRHFWTADGNPKASPRSDFALSCHVSALTVDAYVKHYSERLGLSRPLAKVGLNPDLVKEQPQTARAPLTNPALEPRKSEKNDTTPTDIKAIKGTCDEESHIAEGEIGEDLTQRQSRFFCDAVIMSAFSDNPNHVMFQFVDSRSNHARPIGFSGLLDSDGRNVTLQHVYLDPGKAIAVNSAEDGLCKFYDDKAGGEVLFCAAKIDEGNRRTVPLIKFHYNATSEN